MRKIEIIKIYFSPWKIIPLGCGYYEFTFNTPDDKKNAWYLGTYNLKPEILRFSVLDANHP
jgi:hypothetical protein